MPSGRGRLWVGDVGFPAQAVVLSGVSGEGLNPFAAPSKWVFLAANLVVATAQNVIVPPANMAVRLYRVAFTLTNPAAYPMLVYLRLGSVIEYFALLSAQQPSHFSLEFGPVGIAYGVGTVFDMYCAVNNVAVGIFAQYSLELWGNQNDGD